MPTPCHPRATLIQAAVTTLIKELFATFEARRRARRARCTCDACPRTREVTP